ncbi:MAG TPA: phosphatase PAP2 family protein [Alphaproteobacteria bacterium]|jgi:membrane-associated phospholipid phosphatase|nr:phosphatase PAP2 family protein [Alphaproteobacteria bacterium]
MISGTVGRTLQHDLELLTDFGDTAVLLPLSLVFFIWLLATHRAGTALMWLLIAFACNFVISALKLYFLSCPIGDMLRSPSGHTGFGILVYGSITLVLAKTVRKRWLRTIIVAAGTGLVTAIAISRLILHNHSPLEIVIGGLIGGVSLLVFAALYRPGSSRPRHVLVLAAVTLLVAVIFHGEQVKAEGFLRSLGAQIGLRGEACRYR